MLGSGKAHAGTASTASRCTHMPAQQQMHEMPAKPADARKSQQGYAKLRQQSNGLTIPKQMLGNKAMPKRCSMTKHFGIRPK